MTLAEVESILGGPPGEYGTGKVEADTGWSGEKMMAILSQGNTRRWIRVSPKVVREWRGDEGAIVVCFDHVDRVLRKDFVTGDWRPWTLQERLQLWRKRWRL
jgi:hypothetical protein